MPIEVEAKFVAADPAAFAALRALTTLGAADLGPATSYDETDTYLDTADGRLAAARWACRLRTRGAATLVSLKGPPEPARADAPAWLHRRPEIEGPATPSLDPASWPASEARDLLLDLTRGASIVERLRLAQARTARPVAVRGARLGTLTLDEVEIGGAGPLLAVELELTGDDEARLAAVASALAALPGLAPDPRTKLEHALAGLGEVG